MLKSGLVFVFYGKQFYGYLIATMYIYIYRHTHRYKKGLSMSLQEGGVMGLVLLMIFLAINVPFTNLLFVFCFFFLRRSAVRIVFQFFIGKKWLKLIRKGILMTIYTLLLEINTLQTMQGMQPRDCFCLFERKRDGEDV